LEASSFKLEVVYQKAQLNFKYSDIGAAMNWLKQEQCLITEQHLDQKCRIQFNLPALKVEQAQEFWNSQPDLYFEVLNSEDY